MNNSRHDLSRHIRLDGAHNVRDLGGYPAEAGQTRWGVFFRGDSLHQLTDADIEILLNAGTRTVIDLRHDAEVHAAPNRLAGAAQIAYRHIPIFRGSMSAAGGAAHDLRQVYAYMVDHCQAGLGEALSALADAEDGGVLFHCSAGKDRTGIVAALTLGLAGVPDAVIAADYALTAVAMEALRPILVEQTIARGGSAEALEPLLSSHPEDILALLDYVRATYGGVEAYAARLGLEGERMMRLRERFVEVG
jgi:protein-tyrosine phosphatase